MSVPSRVATNVLIAWRTLSHERARSVLAILGTLLATLLVFLQLGFYMSVPRGGTLFFDAMRFDLMITSSAYVFEAQPASFPRRRLYQALALPEVKDALAVYHASGRWLNPEAGLARDVFVIAFNPLDRVFDLPEVERQKDVLRRPDTVLVEKASRAEFGPLQAGRRIEIEEREVTVGGVYSLGTGFVGIGVAITSDLNFARIFPQQRLDEVNLGLVTLKANTDAEKVAARLRDILPADAQVLTRTELIDHETRYWATQTSAGLIFGFGVIVAIIVGSVILNQTMSTQILRQLPQYATLKAMGYTDRDLGGIILSMATMTSTVSYVPALLLALLAYAIVQRMTRLPMEMTAQRMMFVLLLAWGMSLLSALLAMRSLRRADPADLF
jgi:putative ABC transport system permease protein